MKPNGTNRLVWPIYNQMYFLDVPKLPPLVPEPEPDEVKDIFEDKEPSKARRPSGPKTPDPYQSDDPSIMLPVFVVIGAFIPILFCLCKL